jgi:photosystem II stability/assembly factor-like uncharacterized protein
VLSGAPYSAQVRIFVCTRHQQLIRLDRNGGSWEADSALEGVPVTCIAANGDRILVGTQGEGAWSSADGGKEWERIDLPERDVFSVAISPADGALYAGTEPSRLFVSRDGGPWQELEALQKIPSRETWSFPPRPWTHHVRWIAPDPQAAERLLVGIELGGLMYSEDGGASFTDHRPGAKRDVHALAWHPVAKGRAYEAAGDGAAWSADGGLNWQPLDAGRDLGYCWALACDPADPDRWYLSASSSPFVAHSGEDARGKLYRWRGGAWSELPVPGQSMPYALAASNDELIAGMTDGRILHSRDRGESWEDAGVKIGSVVAMATD